MLNKTKKNRGQTALEYMLVIGVIVVGIVLTSKFIFTGGPESPAGKLMNKAIEKASDTIN